jgi:tRNA nucleotidyltransferase (CCA-adding enzyme)
MLGRHLIGLGCPPGPHFKPALDAAFESQLDGAFYDEQSGIEWMRNYLRAHPEILTSASPRHEPTRPA